jgi:toxin ParE1/3/4
VRHRVEFSSAANEESFEIMQWIAEDSLEAAIRWRRGLDEALARLRTFPRSCRIAAESMHVGVDVRQLIYGSYRVLYRVDGRTVQVLHVRHGAPRRLGEEE